jgi:AbrB family looped-hinge helix DNA binding protein
MAMAARVQVSRVQKKGQVTIPAEMRERLGIKEGDLVVFTETEGGVLVTPQRMAAAGDPDELLDAIGLALKERGITLDELIESGRVIREEISREKYGRADEQ